MFRRRNYIINTTLIVLLGVVAFFGWRTLYPPVAVASARTTVVSTQDVSTSVSATGSVQAAVDLGLNFGTTGIVRQLNVKVGDKVKKGQLLAAVDDRAAKLSLLQAQSSELSAKASYRNAQNGVKTAQNAVITAQGSVTTAEGQVTTAENSLINAQSTLANAEAAIPAAAKAAVITLANSDQSIANAEAALTKLMAGPTAATLASQAQQLQSAQTAIDNANIALTNAYTSQKQVQDNVALNLVNYDRNLSRAQADFDAKCVAIGYNATDCAGTTFAQSQYRALQDATQAKVAGLVKDQQSLDSAATAIKTAERNVLSAQTSLDNLNTQFKLANLPPTQADIDAANANIASAQRAKLTAQANIDSQSLQLAAAVVSAKSGIANAQTSLANAKTGVENSKISLANTKLNIDTAKANVESAKIALKIAQTSLANAKDNLANTKLVAPLNGTIAAIASAVGVNAGMTTAGSGGGQGYIVLTDLTGLQVEASFAEADVVALQVGQTATITFDSIANSSASGEVLSIAPLNNASSAGGSVTSYAVTFSLTGEPEGVKPGMTAQVTVVTAEALSVLAVPSAALTQRGEIYTVTMKPTKVGEPGERRTVTIGLKGDTATEIVSGVSEGDEVELRTTSSSSATSGFPVTGVPGAAITGGGGNFAPRAGG
jgi:multidrug efflux pump subunit AcrA (membrane-fusion protein)